MNGEPLRTGPTFGVREGEPDRVRHVNGATTANQGNADAVRHLLSAATTGLPLQRRNLTLAVVLRAGTMPSLFIIQKSGGL